MWILLMIMFNQPYHVSKVDILGIYIDKEVCIREQKRATAIRPPAKINFGCVKVEGIKHLNNVSRETRR